MAHALETMLIVECGDITLCSAILPLSGDMILKYLRNTSFIGEGACCLNLPSFQNLRALMHASSFTMLVLWS